MNALQRLDALELYANTMAGGVEIINDPDIRPLIDRLAEHFGTRKLATLCGGVFDPISDGEIEQCQRRLRLRLWQKKADGPIGGLIFIRNRKNGVIAIRKNKGTK